MWRVVSTGFRVRESDSIEQRYTDCCCQFCCAYLRRRRRYRQCYSNNVIVLLLVMMMIVTFRDATSWLRTYAERCLWRTVTVVPVMANFLLIYCDVYVCLVLNSGSF